MQSKLGQFHSALAVGDSAKARDLLVGDQEMREAVSKSLLDLPFQNAALRNDVVALELLYAEFECAVDGIEGPLNTPLFYASADGSLDSVRWLLSANAQVNSDEGCSSISAAAGNGHLEIVKILVEHGADLRGIHKVNETALDAALAGKHTEVVEYLQSIGAPSFRLNDDGCSDRSDTPSETKSQLDVNANNVMTFTTIGTMESEFGESRSIPVREYLDDRMPIEIHAIAPSSQSQCVTLFTTGMAQYKMPSGWRMELMMQLPSNWSCDLMDDPSCSWPYRVLSRLAQYPYLNSGFFDINEFMFSFGEPRMQVVPGRDFVAVLGTSEQRITLSNDDIMMMRVTPIFPEEIEYERKHGIDMLKVELDRENVLSVIDIDRNAAPS